MIDVEDIAATINQIARSGQVRNYLLHYNHRLVTNLRDGSLVRLGAGSQVEEAMRQTICKTEVQFWCEPIETMSKLDGNQLADCLY